MTKDEALNMAFAWYGSGNQDPDEFERLILSIVAQREQDGECKHCTDGCPACDARKLPEQKPIAWYDPTNGAVSTDKDSPLFTPLGQVLPLFLEEQPITDDCPNCEYHRQRAQLWRDEAYKQAGHPLPEREWVGLTYEDMVKLQKDLYDAKGESVLPTTFAMAVEAKLKEKNT
jgi:hypothetical protein